MKHYRVEVLCRISSTSWNTEYYILDSPAEVAEAGADGEPITVYYTDTDGESGDCPVDAKDIVFIDEKESVVYCGVCCDYIKKKDLRIWTGDDRIHYLCPGCDSDLLPVQSKEEI